jgi:hypothetical protein
MQTPTHGRLTLLVALAIAAATGACGIREHNVHPITDPPPPPGNPDPGTGGASGGSGGNPGSAGAGGSSSQGGSRAGSGGGGRGGSGGAAGGSGGTANGGAAGGSSGAPDMAPAVPANAVSIAGTIVPREKAIVILHLGHSNMLGEAEGPDALRPFFFEPQPRLWSFRGNGNFIPAVEPTASGGRSRDTAGPGMGLLRAAAMRAAGDVHFISIGYGVGSATSEDWQKGALGHYERVMNLAVQLRGRVTFGAAVIMLGITDRHLPLARQNGFAANVAKIAASIRADLGVPDLPILHTDYEMEATEDLSPDGEVGMRFIPQIRALPMQITRCALVPTDNLGMEDDHHFDMTGQKDWSDRAMQILVDRNWAPWPKP